MVIDLFSDIKVSGQMIVVAVVGGGGKLGRTAQSVHRRPRSSSYVYSAINLRFNWPPIMDG